MIITQITDKNSTELTDKDYDNIIEIVGKALAESEYADKTEVEGY